MGIKERREREKDATRQKILDAAREMFIREGYEAVSMRRIAEAIEYSPTAIYVHFKDKADLMREISNQDFESFTEGLRESANVAEPVERIRLTGRLYIRFAVENPNQFRLMFMTKPAPEVVDMDQEEMAERGRGDPTRDAYAFVTQSVRELIASGRVREDLEHDPELIAQTLWSAVHGVAALHIARPDRETWFDWKGAEAVGEATSQAILRGILRAGAVTEPRRSARGGDGERAP